MKVEKLELKHLAPYLPYGLKIKIGHNDGIMTSCREKDGTIFVYCEDGPAGFLNVAYPNEFQPFLRPLSQLTREILIGWGWSDHLDYFTNELEWQTKRGNILRAPYHKIQNLLKNHYDIFNLIPSGLALELTNPCKQNNKHH